MDRFEKRQRLNSIRALINSIQVRAAAIMHIVEEYHTDLGKPRDVKAFLGWAKVVLGDVLALTQELNKKIEE